MTKRNVDRQCPSCGGFCKKSGCERANVKPALSMTRTELIADLRLNHEYCPKEVILQAADKLEQDHQALSNDINDYQNTIAKQRKVLEQALEALQWEHGGEPLPTLTVAAITAIQEVL